MLLELFGSGETRNVKVILGQLYTFGGFYLKKSKKKFFLDPPNSKMVILALSSSKIAYSDTIGIENKKKLCVTPLDPNNSGDRVGDIFTTSPFLANNRCLRGNVDKNATHGG